MSAGIAIGVDAGGSGTLAIAARDGRELGKGCAGPGNASSLGLDAAADAIARAVRDALGAVAPDVPLALFVGAAGAGREAVARGLEERLRARLPAARALRVADDTLIALRSGIPEGPGIVLIAGTGSVAYAENGEKRARVGGAGYLLGDEGSGLAIGLAALRALARVYDGRARLDAVAELAAAAFEARDRGALLTAIYDAPALDVARIAGLAQGVVALASGGDRAATKIVQVAARDLGDLAIAAAAQADLRDRSPSLVLHGGLLRENSLLTYLLETRLQAELPGGEFIRAELEPAAAALRLAQTMLLP